MRFRTSVSLWSAEVGDQADGAHVVLQSWESIMLAQTLAVGTYIVLSLGIAANAYGDDKEGFKQESRFTNTTYVPVPAEVIEKMFEICKINRNDVIFQLGNDGRVLFEAAKRYGAHGVGINIDSYRIQEAM